MCLNPRVIYHQDHYRSDCDFKPWRLMVPCGQCSECRRLKVVQWNLRSFYEAKACFQSGGFVLFDTLTMDEDNISRFKDIYPYETSTIFDYEYCFDPAVIQKFLKRLRRMLDRLGYNHKNKLRYIITSEFGTKSTCRSHYHCLFYVTFDIDPLLLSKCISDCWHLGRTDGVEFKGSMYVLYNRVFRGFNAASLNKIYYVTKYVSKDFVFSKKVRKKALQCYDVLEFSDPLWKRNYVKRLAFRSFLCKCEPMHLQSLNYGASALDEFDIDYIVDHGSLPLLVPKRNVLVDVPCPVYYMRKLFMDVIYFNGSKKWVYKSGLESLLAKKFDLSIKNFANRFDSWYQVVLPKVEFGMRWREYVDYLLDGRSSLDFAKYVIGVKDRVATYVDDPKYMYVQSFLYKPHYSKSEDQFFAYNTSKDVYRYGSRFVSNEYLPMNFQSIPPDSLFVSSSEILTINDSYLFDYRNFDELFEIFNLTLSYYNEVVEQNFENQEYINYLLKLDGLKV